MIETVEFSNNKLNLNTNIDPFEDTSENLLIKKPRNEPSSITVVEDMETDETIQEERDLATPECEEIKDDDIKEKRTS